MATLDIQQIDLGGLEPSYVAAAELGDDFVNDGEVFFHAKKSTAGDVTLTFDSVLACNQGFDHDLEVTLPGEGEILVGPFGKRFNDENNKVGVTYSAHGDVTVAAIRL
ncbi:MAG: hypothetical protein SWK76_17005 [Actinomycetota bacterium]|nr:hypothetical protein [Actinomycetota bacterium]